MGTARLYFTASIEAQWQSVTGPWLRDQVERAWKDPRPTVILTPSRAEGFYLRSRLVEEGIHFFGLRFWTPSDARTFLLGKLSSKVNPASQVELRLVARVAAEKLLRKKTPANEATLSSTAQEPGAFLRAYDLLLGAGWDPATDGAAYGRGLATEMKRMLRESGIATQSGIHRHLFEQTSAPQKPLLADLLIAGFNATHWPLWDLLRAIVSTADRAVMALPEPRVFGETVDQLWIGSWEEALAVSVEVPEAPDREDVETPFAKLTGSYEQGVPVDARDAGVDFLVAPDLSTQAQAIVLQVIDYLNRDSCTRLGIVFPEPNALALEVSAQLTKLGVPLDDGTGVIQPGIFESRAWTAWIELQQEASVGRLAAWLRACEAQNLSCDLGNLSARDAVDLLEGALAETQVDNLDFLALYLEETSRSRNAGEFLDFLRQRVVLPETASFAEFLSLTRSVLAAPGWGEHLARLQIEPAKWLIKSGDSLSRRTFLAWLKESTDSRERTRGAGNHFYGKVHLLIYAQMTGQTWSHLILTGLNEGVWPRVFESEAFGSRHELAALNQEARGLNRLGTAQGGQGVGHETVQAGHGHCLLPLERLELSLRDLCAAIEGTSEAVCLAAMTTEGGRSLLPSDFFNYACQAKTGSVLDEETFRLLANQTAEWCSRHRFLFLGPGESPPEIAATRIAYEARRDLTRPFGIYEFSFSGPPTRPIQLSCKTWEDAWNHPASVWLERIVGVSPWAEGKLSWPRAVGTWVHRWLALALRECREKKSIESFMLTLRTMANADATRTQGMAETSGISLYPWWRQIHGQAESIALGLGEALVPVLQDKVFLSEFKLPESISVAVASSCPADFALTGRIDLLVVDPGTKPFDPENADFTGCKCWVIDFKTGSAPGLNVKKVGEGTGLQAVLYALAARTRGAADVAISLHTLDAPLKEQVQLDDALAATDLFRSLDVLHRSGVFGMRDDAQNEYGFAPDYPMATRFISGATLETKWSLVHGASSSQPEAGE